MIYKGDYYRYSFNGLTLLMSRWITLLLALVSLILSLLSLFCNAQLNKVPYAGGFAFLSLIPMNFVGIGSILFLSIRGPMRVHQLRECQKSIGVGAVLSGALMAVSVLGSLYWMLCHQAHITAMDAHTLLMNVLICISQCALALMHRKKNYHLVMAKGVVGQ